MNVTSPNDDPKGPAGALDRAPARGRARTRRRILASAIELFAERGLHRVTSHDIAGHAGVAAGTFYNHFSDKQALFREIAFEAVEQLKRELVAATQAAEGPEAGVRRRAEALLDFTERHGDLVRMIFGRNSEASGVGADVLDHLSAWIVTEGLGPRVTSHPEVRAQAVVGMWARVLAWWAERPERADRNAVLDTLTETQLSGPAGAQKGMNR